MAPLSPQSAERRRHEPQTGLDRKALQRLTHHLVGRDAAGDDQGGRMAGDVAEGAQADAGAVDDHVDDRRLEARRKDRPRRSCVSGAMCSASRRSAVLRPESEKFGSARPSIGRGRAKRSGLPFAASRSTCGPPG